MQRDMQAPAHRNSARADRTGRTESTSPSNQPTTHRPWRWIVALLCLGILGYALYRHYGNASKAPASASAPAGRARGGATPVVAKESVRGDLQIYLDGVGTVQALNTVTIHSRVDGELVKVAFEEGQFVHEDDLIAQIDPRAFEVQVSQAEAQQAKDKAALENARHDLQRYETAREAVPQQQLDTAASVVTQFESAVKVDQAAIDNAKLQLSYTKITAPISGRMGLRNIDVGNIVHASDPNGLAVITQVQPIAVVFTLAQGQLPQVQKAMKEQSNVKVLAYDTTLSRLIAIGSVAALDNQIDLTSGTFKVKATFANEDLSLFPNQFVNVRILVDTRKDVVLIPAEALQRGLDTSFVDVIKDDDTVDQRTVTAGPTEAGHTVIEQGLEAGEMVATSGLDRLEPGAKVTVQSSETALSTRGRASTRSAGSQPSTGGGRRGRSGQKAETNP